MASDAARRDSTDRFVVLMPVFNDWEAVRLLLPALDRELAAHGLVADVLCVDDCSTEPAPGALLDGPPAALAHVEILTLNSNVGHQRALAIGLCYLAAHRRLRGVVLMDADGEDRPSDVPRLIDAFERASRRRITFAKRIRRSEGWSFTVFYHLYRLAHRMLTGIPVQIGTFSVVPEAMLSGLVLLPALWKHYAAAVIHAGLAVQTVPTDRAPRLAGTSRMSFTGLAMHGLTALSVFADRIGVRLLVTMATLTVLLTGALSALAILQLLAIVAVPSAVFVAGILAMMCVFQTGLAALMFVFTTERGGEPLAAPLHDYSLFVATCTRVHAADEVLSAGRVGA